jgi:uncharacterized NAD(P)/FAD-binding protein YdhS
MAPPPPTPSIAIVGGGASGTIAAVHAIRSWPEKRPLRVVMYDANGAPGRGVAYGTDDPRHLLNVPAARMSALADEPTHFLDWLSARDPAATPWTFASRSSYGDYLIDTLRHHTAGIDFVVRQRTVTDIVRAPRGFQVRSSHEADLVDAVVLATGNPAPSPLVVDGVELAPSRHYVDNPWVPGALASARDVAGQAGTVLLIGSGLTAVDVALSLAETKPGGTRVVCVSRHGLLPRRHVSPLPEPWPVAVPQEADVLTVRELELFVQQQVAAAKAAGADWRAVIDGLRPHVSMLWQRLPVAERRRFLAGPARLWDVHRHRMAPAVGAVVAELLRQGRFEVRAARLSAVVATASGYDVTLAGPDEAQLHADVIVNCTGPALSAVHGSDQLLTRLVARGLAQYDALGIGLQTDPSGALLNGHSHPQADLLAIGPLRRGDLWESTAVPEIRQQAAAIAVQVTRFLAAATRHSAGSTAGVAD